MSIDDLTEEAHGHTHDATSTSALDNDNALMASFALEEVEVNLSNELGNEALNDIHQELTEQVTSAANGLEDVRLSNEEINYLLEKTLDIKANEYAASSNAPTTEAISSTAGVEQSNEVNETLNRFEFSDTVSANNQSTVNGSEELNPNQPLNDGRASETTNQGQTFESNIKPEGHDAQTMEDTKPFIIHDIDLPREIRPYEDVETLLDKINTRESDYAKIEILTKPSEDISKDLVEKIQYEAQYSEKLEEKINFIIAYQERAHDYAAKNFGEDSTNTLTGEKGKELEHLLERQIKKSFEDVSKEIKDGVNALGKELPKDMNVKSYDVLSSMPEALRENLVEQIIDLKEKALEEFLEKDIDEMLDDALKDAIFATVYYQYPGNTPEAHQDRQETYLVYMEHARSQFSS